MKRTLFVKIFIALMLLCSMGWGYTVTIAASNTTGGSVSPSGARTVDAGKTITVTATANPGRVFTGWGVTTGCSAANRSLETTTITVNGDCKVTGNFSLAYTLTVKATEGGSTSISSHTVVYLGSWPIEAEPSEGYRFDKWTVTSEGEKCSIEDPTSSSTRAIKVTGDCTVQANFVRQYSVVFEISGSGSGTISPVGSQKIDAGSKIDVSVNVNSNSLFFKWYSDNSGCKIGDPNSVSTDVTINGSCKVWVTLGIKHIGTVVAGVGGAVSPSIVVGSAYTPYQEIKAVPNPGYQFLLWEQVSGVYCPIKDSEKAIAGLGIPSGDCTVRAVFEKLPELVVETDGFGKVTPPGVTYPSVGTSVRITATPNSGYRFNKWTTTNKTNCLIANESSASTTVTFNGDCTVTASFSKLGVLNISASEGGSVSPSGESYILSKNTITVTAEPDSGYAFNYWSASTSCNVESKNDKQLVATPTEGQNCNIKAFFQKTYQITIELWNNNAVIPSMRTLTEGYPVSVAYNMGNSHFLYREITSAENCPVSTNSGGIDYVTVRGDCSVRLYFTNFFELTSDFKEYDYSKNSIAGLGDEFRFHAAMENGSWYRVDVASEGAYAGAVLYYGSSQWEDDYGKAYPPVTECLGNDHNFSCYFKSVSDDGYLSVKSTESSKETIPFKIKIEKIDVTEVVVENMVRNKVVSERTVELGFGASAQVAADSITGYVFKEWKAVDGDCVLGDVQGKSIDVTTKSGKCRIRAVYDYDGNTNQYFGISQYFMYSYVSNCNYFGILDMNTEHRANSWANPTYNLVKYLDRSDFSLAIDGEPVALYFAGDSIDSFVGQRFEIPKLTDPMDSTLYFCFETPDEILNGDVHTFEFRSSFGGHDTSFVWDFTEYLAHLPDAPDTVAILAEGDSLGVTRTTKRVRIDVKTQNFSNDAWGVDATLYNATDSLRVKVQCLNSGDEENLWLDLVEDGFYSIADLAKNEVYGKAGKNGAVKGDGVLGCAARDVIVAEYVDPIYKTVTRDTVAFGDVVPVNYQFLNEDLYRDIDSVEATEVNFAFRLNRVSPTLDKADTVMVVLFTDAGDSVWVSAVETDIYSNEFEGFGSFRFVTRKSDVRDDQLEAVMDLESDLNRVVIRMQIGADGSALSTRDSLVVFYQFIPADSAEIHDKDHDGRADFIRVRFAKSISNERLKIDSLFWGSANASGRGAARSIAAENLVVSADGKWIEAALEEPFEYGVTSAAGKGYLRISRKTSSVSQKVMLTDKVGAVPVSAVKRPGRLSDLDLLSGKTEMPFDTLVVTMSEPLDTMARLQCRSLRKSESGDSKDLCTAQEMFTFAGEGRVRTVYKESYSRDKSGRVWTFVLPRNVNIRVGDVVRSNWRAFVEDAAGNAMGDGGVVVTGEDNDLYIYSIKAFPEVVGSGKAPRWFNPEKGESERMEGASIRVETRMAYDAAVSVFDNMGHVVSQFKHSFGKHGEKEDDAYVSDENATFVSFIRWDTKTLEKRLAGSGVYIWKIKFRFEDGHVEWRTIRSGIRR